MKKKKLLTQIQKDKKKLKELKEEYEWAGDSETRIVNKRSGRLDAYDDSINGIRERREQRREEAEKDIAEIDKQEDKIYRYLQKHKRR